MKQTKVNTIQFKEFMKAFVEKAHTIPGADVCLQISTWKGNNRHVRLGGSADTK